MGHTRYNHHHIVPKSRGGRKGKVIEIPVSFHQAWHTLFGNLYGEEVVDFIIWINKMFQEKDILTEQEIEEERTVIKRLFKKRKK